MALESFGHSLGDTRRDNITVVFKIRIQPNSWVDQVSIALHVVAVGTSHAEGPTVAPMAG